MLSTSPRHVPSKSVWYRLVSGTAMGKMQEVWTQPLTTAVFFFGGVAYDTLTLTRIDRLLDQLILLLYLSLLGALIVLTGRAQLGLLPQAPDSHRAFHPLQLIHRVQPHIPKALQFLFGGLFSAYAIYYFQSASLTTTAVFLGFIVILLIVNEWFHNHVSSLTMLLALFAIVMMSFLTFFLPVVLGRMNAWIFLVGAGLSGVIVWRLLSVMYRGAVGATTWAQWRTGAPALAMITLMIGFYFLNWIPPVPLSLKFAGMYHQVQRVDGEYQLTFTKGAWYQIWKRSDEQFDRNEAVYCFTAVFAPVALETTIYHHWAYRPPNHAGSFTTTDRIPVHISGGRAQGYRGYTVKQRVDAGEWRVDVETEDGRVIGRLTFDVSEAHANVQHEWETMMY